MNPNEETLRNPTTLRGLVADEAIAKEKRAIMQQVEMNYKLQDVLTEQLYQLEDRLGVVLTQAEQPLEAREDSTRAGDSALYYKLNEQGKAMQSMIDKVSNIINRLEV